VVDFREDKWWGLYNGQCFEKNIVGQFSCSIDYCEIGWWGFPTPTGKGVLSSFLAHLDNMRYCSQFVSVIFTFWQLNYTFSHFNHFLRSYQGNGIKLGRKVILTSNNFPEIHIVWLNCYIKWYKVCVILLIKNPRWPTWQNKVLS
jgi:hypothetical protein